METETLIVSEEEEGERLDKFLAGKFDQASRTYFQYLIQEGLVLVNQKPVKKRVIVQRGDEIEIEFILTPEIKVIPEEIPLRILFEDEWLLAIDKPAGLVVHPAPGNWTGTFANALLFYCKTLPESASLRPGIVHRLDKETSGVLVAAKNLQTQEALIHAFATRKVEKTYLGICIGNPGNRWIDAKIGRDTTKRKEMAIQPEKGKEAKTWVETLATDGHLSFVRLLPETGRTHQLRVHLKSIGTPILGDSLYGNKAMNKKFKAERQLLHAYKLVLQHPHTKKRLELTAPLPDDIKRFTVLTSTYRDK